MKQYNRYFKQILVADLRMYGEVDLDELVEINETKSQVEIDAVFNGTAGEPNDDSDSEDNWATVTYPLCATLFVM